MLVSVVLFTEYVLGPALAGIHPAFGVPVISEWYLGRYFSVNWNSGRLYLLFLLENVVLFAWAWVRQDELWKNIEAPHGIDRDDLERE
ncbi:hypothetical protein [Haloarchaeobius sp. HME9146]|uniref:hypothetical protein n=1 Tax=Haloarchaeobius sp. HME9146 TaxID=2978732 RepID=UPI0021BF0115|nr:hypothetical protein [Haloarchaeobius sp. HME9146]MCT9098411.1 hypothetical protein [Haloarchaeobius sp. HME9146]